MAKLSKDKREMISFVSVVIMLGIMIAWIFMMQVDDNPRMTAYATGGNPTPTPTFTPFPTVTYTHCTASGNESGSAYFFVEGIGYRAFSTYYTITYHKCSDGFAEFRPADDSCFGTISPLSSEAVWGWSVYLTLRTSGTLTSWFGPSAIPQYTGIQIGSPGSFSVSGVPSSFACGPLPSQAFFDSFSVVIWLPDGEIGVSVTVGADCVINL